MFTLYYKPKKVSEINLKSDSRISLIGKIIEKKDDSFVLDDGSGKIEIFSEEEVEENKLIRVFCSIIEKQIKADIIQDLNGFDLNLFNKVRELYNKAGV